MHKTAKHTVTALLMSALAGPAIAGEAEATQGLNRAQTGATDALTSPVKIVDGINADTAQYGPAGVVTGSVKGGFRAAAQLVTGAVNVGVGAVEVIASPLTGK